MFEQYMDELLGKTLREAGILIGFILFLVIAIYLLDFYYRWKNAGRRY